MKSKRCEICGAFDRDCAKVCVMCGKITSKKDELMNYHNRCARIHEAEKEVMTRKELLNGNIRHIRIIQWGRRNTSSQSHTVNI